jgi:hypothetical protein
MLAWLIGIPVLVFTAGGAAAILRANPRRGLRAVKLMNAVLLVPAGVIVVLTLTAPTSLAATTTTTGKPFSGQALIGAAIAVAGSRSAPPSRWPTRAPLPLRP